MFKLSNVSFMLDKSSKGTADKIIPPQRGDLLRMLEENRAQPSAATK
jgi:hypothetical protein